MLWHWLLRKKKKKKGFIVRQASKETGEAVQIYVLYLGSGTDFKGAEGKGKDLGMLV